MGIRLSKPSSATWRYNCNRCYRKSPSNKSSEEAMFIRDAEISNRIYLDISPEISEIVALKKKIKSLTEKNMEMQQQLCELQDN
jgi:hypothetical protein